MRRCITRQIWRLSGIWILSMLVVVLIVMLAIVCVDRSHSLQPLDTGEVDAIYQSVNVNDVIAGSVVYITALENRERRGYKFRAGERKQCIFIAYKNLIIAYGSMGDIENMGMYLLRLDAVMHPGDDSHANVKHDLEICIISAKTLHQPVWLDLSRLMVSSNAVMDQIKNNVTPPNHSR